jgi:putative ABC transport system permease protein
MKAFPWGTALRIAWREGRAAKGKFLFVALAVAAGVASITGVRGFSEAFRGMLLREARTLMAADMTVRTFEAPNAPQLAVLEDLERRGIVMTRITETVSMISAPGAQDPLLVSVKAVDPAVYPFYGQIRTTPAGSLGGMLTPDGMAVSEDLLLRLNLAVGDRVKLGEEEYRIAAVVTMEPDRMTGSLNVGPRVMLSREGLERSGLMAPGSRASQRFLFRLPAAGPDVAQVRLILKRAFPESMIADYRETHPLITRGLNRATTFLGLVSLVSLIVGALGVATAMHSHLQQRMDSIAVMKCLGARSSQIIRIYVVQTLLLGLAGSLAGIALGLAVQAAFPALVARYFPLRPGIRLDFLSSRHAGRAAVLGGTPAESPHRGSRRGHHPRRTGAVGRDTRRGLGGRCGTRRSLVRSRPLRQPRGAGRLWQALALRSENHPGAPAVQAAAQRAPRPREHLSSG